MSNLIEMNNVNFTVEGKAIVPDLSLTIEEGRTIAIVGPSGGGKTTVLKLAAGLILPTEGEVLFRGKDISRMGKQESVLFRREAAFVFQDSALWANQDLYQNLELPLKMQFSEMSDKERKKKIDERIAEVVAEVGYKKDLRIRPAQLSMGEQKLIAFARALMCRPRVLYLDEWTESLDQTAAQRLINIVQNMKNNGGSVILVSHNMHVILSMADIVIMIVGGEITLQLTKEQIKSDEGLRLHIEKGMAS